MKINVIDRPVEGSPVLLIPEGILLRWPRDEPLPEIGEPFEGKTIRLRRPEHLEVLLDLLRGNAVERCEAAFKLPMDVVRIFYSSSLANNMRRVARKMTPELRNHVLSMIESGHRVSTKQLITVIGACTKSGQLQRWNALSE